MGQRPRLQVNLDPRKAPLPRPLPRQSHKSPLQVLLNLRECLFPQSQIQQLGLANFRLRSQALFLARNLRRRSPKWEECLCQTRRRPLHLSLPHSPLIWNL